MSARLSACPFESIFFRFLICTLFTMRSLGTNERTPRSKLIKTAHCRNNISTSFILKTIFNIHNQLVRKQ